MKGIDLKKKLGPLPVWGWALLGAGGLGLVYYLRSKSSASTAATTSTVDPNTIDPSTGIPWSQEAQANAANIGAGSAGSAANTPAPTTDLTGIATGLTSTDQLATELAVIQAELSTQSNGALVNASPATTITGEATDLLNAQAALQQLGLGGTGAGSMTPTTGGTPAAKGKSAAGLTILAQLQDLQKGLITKTQLGPNAAKQLTAVGGNVAKAITARATPLTVAAAKPTTHATVTPPKAPPKATVKSNNAEAARRGS